MKKRIVSSVLCLIMLASMLCSCSLYYSLFGYDESYVGPTVDVYLSDMPTNLDPLYAYNDDAASYIMSLIFEGLFRYDENGDVEKAMAKSYKKIVWDTEKGDFQIEIKLKDSAWNDQSAVSADQFVYAWRRFLDPQINTPGAVLLYDIKNAKKIKCAEGDLTKFDFGATAVDSKVLRIEFEPKLNADGKTYAEPDLDAFFEKLASPLLVPLRSEGVSRLRDWACSNATIYCNGPFFIKTFHFHESGKNIAAVTVNGDTLPAYINHYDDGFTLERNKYYLRDTKVDPINSYVEPHTIRVISRSMEYTKNDAGVPVVDENAIFADQATRALVYYQKGEVSLLTYIPISERTGLLNSLKNLENSQFTHSYYFNTQNPLFEKAEVRQALSMVIDRNELAKKVVYATPATTVINPKTFENGYSKKSGAYFNDHSDAYYNGTTTKKVSATAESMDKAKALLQAAGVTSGSFTITVKASDEVSLASAEYCKAKWTELGFDVSIRELGSYRYTENTYDGAVDLYKECFFANGETVVVDMTDRDITKYTDSAPGLRLNNNKTSPVAGFDVIAVDLYQSTTDAFTVLAPFSKEFSGGAIDLSVSKDEYEAVLPITGYNSEAYNNAIVAAYETADKETRAKKLHEAEAILMTDLPVMPLFVIQNPLIYSDNLRGVDIGYAGLPILSDVTDKNYKEE